MNSIHSGPKKPTHENKIQNQFKSEKNNFENYEMKGNLGFEHLLEKTNVLIFLKSDENKFLREYQNVYDIVKRNHNKLKEMVKTIEESDSYKNLKLSVEEKKTYERINVEIIKCEWEINELKKEKEKLENNRLIVKNVQDFISMYNLIETLRKELDYMNKDELVKGIVEIINIEHKMYESINYILPKEIIEDRKFRDDFEEVKKVLEEFKERKKNYKGRKIKITRCDYENLIKRESTIQAKIREVNEMENTSKNKDMYKLVEILQNNSETSTGKISSIENRIIDKKLMEYGKDIVKINKIKKRTFEEIEKIRGNSSMDIKKYIYECDNLSNKIEFLLRKIKREYKPEEIKDLENFMKREISTIEKHTMELEKKLTRYNKVIREIIKYQRMYRALEKVSILAWVVASVPISMWFKESYNVNSMASLIVGASIGFNAYLSTMLAGLTGDLLITKYIKK